MRSMFAPVTIYGQPGCRYCVSAVGAFEDHGIKFDYVDISTNDEAKSYVMDVLGARQVPVIVDEHHDPVIGADDYSHIIDFHREDPPL